MHGRPRGARPPVSAAGRVLGVGCGRPARRWVAHRLHRSREERADAQAWPGLDRDENADGGRQAQHERRVRTSRASVSSQKSSPISTRDLTDPHHVSSIDPRGRRRNELDEPRPWAARTRQTHTPRIEGAAVDPVLACPRSNRLARGLRSPQVPTCFALALDLPSHRRRAWPARPATSSRCR